MSVSFDGREEGLKEATAAFQKRNDLDLGWGGDSEEMGSLEPNA